MMQTRKLLGLFLLGSFLLGNGLNATSRAERMRLAAERNAGNTQPVPPPAAKKEVATQMKSSVSSSSSSSMGSSSRAERIRLAAERSGQQSRPEPDTYAGSGSQGENMAPAAAIAHALEILQFLAQDLVWNGVVINDQAGWARFMNSISEQLNAEKEAGRDFRDSHWQMNSNCTISVR